MFGVLLLCLTGLVSFSTAHGDDVKFTIPGGQPAGIPQFVRIEEPHPDGKINHDYQYAAVASAGLSDPGIGQIIIFDEDYDDTLKPGEKRCPVDGDPHCRNCRAGYKDSDFVQSQCCFAHHWAWMNNRTIRDVLPYRFHLSPVNQTELPKDRYHTAGEIWQEDPCTKEPVATIPNGTYIPCRQRNACPDVRENGTIW
ncbi:uncharacterized protein LOC129598483 [Paramacrobiotus metropolitanus]|uniref:uncharacterized protein LOC129598483 n=1 Tax=Paramacrobiotus metropolitanus TaxID=2943436 RepID=UPI0024459298|nr:uncharacterized protein LOC129598483 [Paramacrobiotus metropolitanus]